MTRARFEQLVAEALQTIPKRFRDEMHNVVVIVEQEPTTQQTVIKVEPAQPEQVYVPAYNPQVVYGAWPYPAYPPYYSPPPPYYYPGAALATGIPVIFGILTCDTVEQALNRSGLKAGNKGADAALAAVEMVNLLQKLPRKT